MAKTPTGANGTRRVARRRYGAGAAVATAAASLLVAMNGAVGFLGSEENPANLLFAGVLAVAALGAVAVRFRAAGLAQVMTATAVAQGLVGAVALAAGLGAPGWKGVYEVVLGTGLFAGLWLLAARLFRSAARLSRS